MGSNDDFNWTVRELQWQRQMAQTGFMILHLVDIVRVQKNLTASRDSATNAPALDTEFDRLPILESNAGYVYMHSNNNNSYLVNNLNLN